MMKALVAGLLSMTALVPPALAQEPRAMDRGQWRRDRAERPVPVQDGPVRPAEQRGWERAGTPGRAEADAPRPDRPASPERDWRGARGARGDGVPRPPEPGRGDDWRQERGGQDRRDGTPPMARPAPDADWRSERAEPRRRYDGRDRPPPPPSSAWRSGRDDRWDRDWRRQPRYDWNRYRAERRSAFRLPRYYAPYGWDGGYRRFGIGTGLAPMLYTPRYWIYDPYAYRLPDAEEPYRWVRYYGDALLVDIEDGTVVDVIHGIFD